jgi:Cdc6-like AAA superfamily ATPase
LNSSMNQLKADINNDKQMEARKKQSQEIKEALDNPSNSSAKIYKDIIGKKIDGTGEWLKLDPLYASWVVTQQSSTQILYLSGEKGSGKSFLMSTIIEDLKRRYKQRSGDLRRTSIAYYYFQKEVKTSQTAGKEPLSIDTALKSLACQITDSDAVYRKELHASCKSLEELQKTKDLWVKLFVSSYKADATFYLLLDDVDQLEKKQSSVLAQLLQEIQKSSSEGRSLCLRILISGTDKAREGPVLCRAFNHQFGFKE